MSKKQTIDAIASKLDCSKVKALEFYDAYHAFLTECLNTDGEYTISGIGTFRVKHRAKRKGRNPRTGESIDIPARQVVGFKAAPTLLSHLNNASKDIDQVV
ncbi:MAG: HU family DNA-binding protein [Gammaproteobacteria bacterium]|nr:HU family DNA-binding protein [Gammaproteobacteria bacterium]